MVLTRAMCPPGSLYDRIVKDWSAVRSYVIKDGHVFLSLMADGGIYEYEPAGGSQSAPSQEAHVTGTVSYRQRIALTWSAVVEVRLLDVSRADASSITIAERTIKPAGRQVPIAFDLAYDPQRINSRGSYSIQVRILDPNKLRFTSTDAYPVITGGHPNKVNVIVKPIGK
jgi:putative lipoprotein